MGAAVIISAVSNVPSAVASGLRSGLNVALNVPNAIFTSGYRSVGIFKNNPLNQVRAIAVQQGTTAASGIVALVIFSLAFIALFLLDVVKVVASLLAFLSGAVDAAINALNKEADKIKLKPGRCQVVLNFFSGALNNLADVINALIIVINSPIRSTYFYARTIINSQSINSQTGRRLTESSLIDLTEVLTSVQPAIYTLAWIQDAILQVNLFVLRFILQLDPGVLFVITQVLVNIVYKLLCLFTGVLCGVRELADALINIPFPLHIGPFTIGPFDIGCDQGELIARGVQCSCGGPSLFDLTSPGAFRRMNNGNGLCANSRRMLRCDKIDETTWVEYVDGRAVHSAEHIEDACYHVRASLSPTYTPRVFEVLDAHDTFSVCVMGVGYTVHQDIYGQHTVTLTGSCSKRFKGDLQHARNVLSFFGNTTLVRNPTKRSLNTQQPPHTRAEMIAYLETIGKQFTTKYGQECNLNLWDYTNPYAVAVDLGCIAGKLFSDSRSESFGKSTRRDLSEQQSMLEGVMRRLRVFSTLPATMTPLEKMQALTETQQGVYEWGHDQMTVHMLMGHVEKVLKKRRRRLSSYANNCNLQGLAQCSDQFTCVQNGRMDLCPPENPSGYTPVTAFDQVISNVQTSVDQFSMNQLIANMNECWDNYRRNPSTDPYSHENIRTRNDDNVVWCFPMITQFDYRFPELDYNMLTYTLPAVCGNITDPWHGCSCPMYIQVPLDTSSNWLGFIYTGFESRMQNSWTQLWFLISQAFSGISAVFLYPFSYIAVAASPNAPSNVIHPQLYVSTGTADWVCFARNSDNLFFLIFVMILLIIAIYALYPIIIFIILYIMRPVASLIWTPNENSRLNKLIKRTELLDKHIKERVAPDIITKYQDKILTKSGFNPSLVPGTTEYKEKMALEAQSSADKPTSNLKKQRRVTPSDTV